MGSVTAVAWITAVVLVQSLAQELPHFVGICTARKKKKKKKFALLYKMLKTTWEREGVPVLAQRFTNPTNIHENVSLIPGLAQWSRIRCSQELQCRSQTRLGSCLAVTMAQVGSRSSDSTPSPGNSTCCRYGLKSKNKQTNKTTPPPKKNHQPTKQKNTKKAKKSWERDIQTAGSRLTLNSVIRFLNHLLVQNLSRQRSKQFQVQWYLRCTLPL